VKKVYGQALSSYFKDQRSHATSESMVNELLDTKGKRNGEGKIYLENNSGHENLNYKQTCN
jgi:hypothetical protein